MRASSGKSSSKYAILSNTIVLLLIGFFLLLYFHSGNIINLLKEKINIIVEVNPNSNIEQIKSSIAEYPYIVKGSVDIIPAKDALKILGINELDFGLNDSLAVFKDLITFNIRSDHYDEKSLIKTKEDITQLSGVSDVFYENVEISNIKSNLQNISFIILILSLVFVFLALVIMYNTIRLSLYADQSEIKTMVIIGARDNFIRQPYIKLAGMIAMKSFLAASLILLLILVWVSYNFGLFSILKWYYLILAITCIFIISIIICVGSTIFIVNKYLDEEYAL